MSPRVIRIAAAGVEDDRGQLLLVRKRGTAAFMQPGGKIGAGESPEAALRREIKEELGVEVAGGSLIALGRRRAVAANEPGTIVDAELFLAILETTPTPCAEIEEIMWVDPWATQGMVLAPLTRDHVLPMARADFIDPLAHFDEWAGTEDCKAFDRPYR